MTYPSFTPSRVALQIGVRMGVGVEGQSLAPILGMWVLFMKTFSTKKYGEMKLCLVVGLIDCKDENS